MTMQETKKYLETKKQIQAKEEIRNILKFQTSKIDLFFGKTESDFAILTLEKNIDLKEQYGNIVIFSDQLKEISKMMKKNFNLKLSANETKVFIHEIKIRLENSYHFS